MKHLFWTTLTLGALIAAFLVLGGDAHGPEPASAAAAKCTGFGACDGIDPATVADGSCNGTFACNNAVGPIGENSCNGNFVCDGTGGSIGAGSCTGVQGCRFVAHAIGDNSCLGGDSDQPCKEAAGPIGDGSCHGLQACIFTAQAIGNGSCVGNGTCQQTVGAVGDGACTAGDRACQLAGTVGDGACHGYEACDRAVGPTGEGSCIGDNACSFAGASVGAYSCNGLQACLSHPSAVGDCELNLVPVDGCNDDDGDLFLNYLDGCPAAAEDVDGFEDTDGCPDPDNDGDTVPDTSDQCQGELEDLDGFQDSDGCPDPDNDGDTVLDAADNCPNAANLDQADVDGDDLGDPCDPDDDNDTVADTVDQCPLVPEDPDGYQDGDGCPDPGDQTKPVVTVQVIDEATGQPYVPGTPTRGPVLVQFSCSDGPGGSGIPGPGHNDTTSSTRGNTYPAQVSVARTQAFDLESRWRCVDAAGNVANAPGGFPLSVVIDRRAPTCKITLSKTKVPKSGTPTGVTATVSGADNLAGPLTLAIVKLSPAPEAGGPALPAASPASWTLKGGLGKTFTFTGRVTDQAGNSKDCTARVLSR